MIYLFEDKQSTQLSTLFREAYPTEVSSKFCYANGNAKLKETANRLLREYPEEAVLVFIDIIPDNKWQMISSLRLTFPMEALIMSETVIMLSLTFGALVASTPLWFIESWRGKTSPSSMPYGLHLTLRPET